MDINKAEEKFLDYVEGRLSDAERGEFESSLNQSAELKRKFQEFTAISNLGDEISKQEYKLGADFTVKLMERIEAQKEAAGLGNPAVWLRRLIRPAAVCATVVVALIIVKNQETASTRILGEISSPAAVQTGTPSDLQKQEQPRTEEAGKEPAGKPASSIDPDLEKAKQRLEGLNRNSGQSAGDRPIAAGGKEGEPVAAAGMKAGSDEAAKPAAPPAAPFAGGVSDLLPPGHRAATVSVEKSEIAPQTSTPGSHVDLAVTYKDQRTGETKTIIAVEDAVVLSAGGAAGSKNKAEQNAPVEHGGPAGEAVTLAMPAGDAVRLGTARELGNMVIIPRPAYDIKSPGAVTANDKIAYDMAKPRSSSAVNNGRVKYRYSSGTSNDLETDSEDWIELGESIPAKAAGTVNGAAVLGQPGTAVEDLSGSTAVREMEAAGFNSPQAELASANTANGSELTQSKVVANEKKDFDAARWKDYLLKRQLQSNPNSNPFGSYQPAPVQPEQTEVYGESEENPPVLVSEQPVSTFSLDVDTGSFTNSRRFLSMGALPPKNGIRVEEFINYFDYDYSGEGVKPLESSGPFAVYFEAAPSPLQPDRTLLKIGVKTKHLVQNDDLPWNLVFLIDVSGSMADDNKLPLLKRSLRILVERMRPMDRIGIVTYSNSAEVRLENSSAANKEQINRIIDSLIASGGTNGADGIDKAYRLAESSRVESGVNRVILATDGDFNVGNYSFDGLMELVAAKKKGGISLTTIGYGSGNYNEKNMEQLADRGDGNYFYIDSFNEARRVFAEEIAKTVDVVAKDVKLQIEFNPAHVAAYRLVGYDNRKLNNEDFHNDAVDAGEVGGDQTVTALYELVLTGTPLAERLKSELRYQKEKGGENAEVPAAVQSELGFLKVRFKDPKAADSRMLQFPIQKSEVKAAVELASPDLKFAAAVAYFAQVLRQSKYAGNYSIPEIIKLADSSKGEDQGGKRHEFIGLMKNVSSLQAR